MPEQEVILKDIPAQHTLSIREVVPTQEHIAILLGQTCGAVFGQGVQPTNVPLTIYHDADFKEEDLDIEIVLPVDKSAPQAVPLDENRQVTARKLPQIQAACIIHTGDYDSILESYGEIADWIEKNDYEIVGQVREVYLRPHTGEEEGIAEIQFPVNKS